MNQQVLVGIRNKKKVSTNKKHGANIAMICEMLNSFIADIANRFCITLKTTNLITSSWIISIHLLKVFLSKNK